MPDYSITKPFRSTGVFSMKYPFKRKQNTAEGEATKRLHGTTKYAKWAAVFAMAAAVLTPAIAAAQQTIAHRGMFHDVLNRHNLPENSYDAIVRAHDMGLKGVELDLRLSSDGQVLVTHDQIANRTTVDDYDHGRYNPLDSVNGGWSPAPHWLHWDNAHHWSNTRLKVYGKNGELLNNYWGFSSYMQTLDSLFNYMHGNRSDILSSDQFMIILDVQDPTVLAKAAQVIQNWAWAGTKNSVYVKFFASKAVFNIPQYRYNGADTCYVYERDNNLRGLKIIPQINDGELAVDPYSSDDENDDQGIGAFQTWLPIEQYLQCWADAQAQHWDAAQMPIVSASVPSDNVWATKGAWKAINWARGHGRQTMSIVPNPDAARWDGKANRCVYYTWQSTKVPATYFSDDARAAKQSFVNSAHPDYLIIDTISNVHTGWWGSDSWAFRSLCY
jgi:glycerophosphoryl diester phosphodiesterase